MSTSDRSSGDRPGIVLALLLALSALVAVGIVVALELLVGEWWAAVAAVGAVVAAWTLVAVTTYERPARRSAAPARGVGLIGRSSASSSPRRSRTA